MNWFIYLDALYIMLAMTTVTWLLSIYLRNVTIVDSLWPLLFLGGATVYLLESGSITTVNLLLFGMLCIWAVRLCVHLSLRNWGQPEDHRYQEIRKKYSPHFAVKSLFIVFVFQAVLAWVVSLPLFAALGLGAQPNDNVESSFWVILAILVWLTGMVFESVADWQLAKFKSKVENRGRVMNKGLWRFTRHPNYFGEFLIWWSYFLFTLPMGGWWSIISPIIMTWLLLKFSGVVLLEKTISERRPAYQDYIKHTNAFFPGLPRNDHGKHFSKERVS